MTTIPEEEKDHDSIYNKPDTIDTFIKPDTIDSPIYEKPNAYDEIPTPVTTEVVDELAIKLTTASQLETLHKMEQEDGEGSFLNTIVRYKTRKSKMAPSSVQQQITSTNSSNHSLPTSLISKVQSTTTTTTTITNEEIDQQQEDIFYSPNNSNILLSPTSIHHHPYHSNNNSNSHLSLDGSISPSLSNSTIDSTTSTSSTSKQMLLDSLKRRSSKDVISYDIRKHALTQSHHHDIYLGGTKELIYRKRQPHSYSWGFQNILYQVKMDQDYQNAAERYTKYGMKIAEARRRAFQKDITIEWGLDEVNHSNGNNNNDDKEEEDKIADGDDDDDDMRSQESQDISKPRCRKFLNVNNSHLLFIYTTQYDTQYCLRWKRPSLVSHDMTCEIRKLEQEDDPLEDEVKKKKKDKKKKNWQLLAEFDSHGMGYLIHIGRLTIDKRGLGLVERPDHLESHLLITCCTLVDLMREVVQKAVGLSSGGVASSN
ncbi:hypothetical protein BJ944DRAFT_264564 [Cunninghamella echinulata]|nr:hypothetical protein BJ944DRAFT_264564 [Cunninghamella echinulata]